MRKGHAPLPVYPFAAHQHTRVCPPARPQVSHDRDFLNSVTTDIIHLHDNMLNQYRGNFAQFEEMYEQKRREVNKVRAVSRAVDCVTSNLRRRDVTAGQSASEARRRTHSTHART